MGPDDLPGTGFALLGWLLAAVGAACLAYGYLGGSIDDAASLHTHAVAISAGSTALIAGVIIAMAGHILRALGRRG